MTSTTETTQHPDVSEISDLTEGLLSPSRAADVRRHLDNCTLCADVLVSLEDIRGLLGTLPGPPRMPADIAGRIDAALAAEALLNATVSDDAAHVSRETTFSSETLSPPNTSPSTGAAAAGPLRGYRTSGLHNKAATSPGRSAHSRRRRRKAFLNAAWGTTAVAVSVLLLHALQSVRGSSDDQASSLKSSTTIGSPQFSGALLQVRVDALLAAGPLLTKNTAKANEHSTSDGKSPNSAMRDPDPLPVCIQRGTGRTEPVIAFEQGIFEGSRAYLLVLPRSGDGTQVSAYVIDAACVETAPSTKGKVLLMHSYPRH